MSNPGAPAQGKYQGPGVAEWILGFICSGLVATQLRATTQPIDPQSALSYYFANPNVRLYHNLSIAIDVVIVLCVAAWIFMWRRSVLWQTIIAIMVFAGIALVWIELLQAMQLTGRKYTLPSLPFSPINNLGLFGAGVFVAYLSLMLPTGELSGLAKIGQKVALAAGVFGVQLILFEQVARRFA